MAAIPPHILGRTQISRQPLGSEMQTWPVGHTVVQAGHFPALVSSGEGDTMVAEMTKEARTKSCIVDESRFAYELIMS